MLRDPRHRHSAPQWGFLCEISGWNEQTIEEGERLVSPDVSSTSLLWHRPRLHLYLCQDVGGDILNISGAPNDYGDAVLGE